MSTSGGRVGSRERLFNTPWMINVKEVPEYKSYYEIMLESMIQTLVNLMEYSQKQTNPVMDRQSTIRKRFSSPLESLIQSTYAEGETKNEPKIIQSTMKQWDSTLARSSIDHSEILEAMRNGIAEEGEKIGERRSSETIFDKMKNLDGLTSFDEIGRELASIFTMETFLYKQINDFFTKRR
ncbi:unnamed protein product [Rotaria sp. Silwood2]|nr:unnamed protein product [Rotaria sp. Silwood2]CAF4706268.1 unnamed protein product [Rotaria sp. Silwood2]CAF4712918.1 unnamed protein product [Rotaria sp. Silwood2]